MKKKIPFTLVLAAALLLAVGALAATGAFDTLRNVWQSSFERMNTSGSFDAVEDFDIEGFEKEYGGVKEDLVISTVPDENDLSYEAAEQIARQAVITAYAVPEEELDAMGLYPRFVKAVYNNYPSEWEFYYTPRTDTDIDEDHDYPAPGEYRVFIESPSGTVTGCFFYNDDFWPTYAQRVWDGGNHDYVYKEAQRTSAFFAQTRENQQFFLNLFKEAGYDTDVLQRSPEAMLQSLDITAMSSKPEESLLHSTDPSVTAVLSAMEAKYGLTADMLEKYNYCVIPSPLTSDTADYLIAYNYNIEAKRIENGEYGDIELIGVSYVKRLGLFMARVSRDTQRVSFVRVPCVSHEQLLDASLLLGRADWTQDDLTEYEAMLEELRAIDAQLRTGETEYGKACGLRDEVMRAYGGDPTIYHLNSATGIDEMPREKAQEIALQAVADKMGMTLEQAAFVYESRSAYYVYERNRQGEWVEYWCCRVGKTYETTVVSDDAWCVNVSIPDGSYTMTQDTPSNG